MSQDKHSDPMYSAPGGGGGGGLVKRFERTGSNEQCISNSIKMTINAFWHPDTHPWVCFYNSCLLNT